MLVCGVFGGGEYLDGKLDGKSDGKYLDGECLDGNYLVAQHWFEV